jgi:hypothetical protein
MSVEWNDLLDAMAPEFEIIGIHGEAERLVIAQELMELARLFITKSSSANTYAGSRKS